MPKKISIVTGMFPSRSETFVTEHAVGLACRGYEVTVISQGVGPGMSLTEVEAIDTTGVRRVGIHPYGRRRLPNILQMGSRLLKRPSLIRWVFPRKPWTRRELFLADAYAEVIAKIQPDTVHIHYGSYAGALSRIGLPENPIVTWHGYDANLLPPLRGDDMYHELFAAPYRHTVGSHFMVDRVKALGCHSNRIQQIPMGVDLGKFVYVDRSRRASDILQLVSVGRLSQEKGHRYLVAAVIKLIARGLAVRLRVVGEGPLRGELEAQILESSVGNEIVMLGARGSAEVRQELAGADLFVLSGVRATNGAEETQGVVLIEAQAIGLPVVASNVGGIPGSLIDGETGILCEPKNVDQLVQAVQRYAENKELRLAHGRAAAEFVQQRFSLSKMLDSFEALYNFH